LCCEAFEDYDKNAVTFSKQEMEVIKYELADRKAFALEGLSKRERKEFLKKI
jgi:hypothetical protein